MQSVEEHYANHLGPVYTWMVGGVDAAIARGEAELQALRLEPRHGSVAVDLGAGFGMHALPLATRGYSVIAVDSCRELLDTLSHRTGELPIQVVESDLLAFRRNLTAGADLVLCMGDTLTHLPDQDAVMRLFAEVAAGLTDGGTFVLTFRDYSSALTAERRFIPVRSDADRILTCFLEYEDRYVTVHDLLHEREGSQWQLRVSSYRKLRMSPEWVIAELQSRSFSTQLETSASGMLQVIAQLRRRD